MFKQINLKNKNIWKALRTTELGFNSNDAVSHSLNSEGINRIKSLLENVNKIVRIKSGFVSTGNQVMA